MKTAKGIKVIEFNARFGDPETEVVLPRLTSDIFDIFNDVLDCRTPCIEWDSRAAIGFVLASKGYPENYRKGFEIKHLDTLKGVEAKKPTIVMFSDPECPYCRLELEKIEATLKESNVKLILTRREIGRASCRERV